MELAKPISMGSPKKEEEKSMESSQEDTWKTIQSVGGCTGKVTSTKERLAMKKIEEAKKRE